MTIIAAQPDPTYPGRTTYQISAPTRDAVQAVVTYLMNLVDGCDGNPCGFANFVGPHHFEGGFAARGEVIVEQDQPPPAVSVIVKRIRDAVRS